MKIDTIRRIIELFEQSNVSKMELEHADFTIRLEKKNEVQFTQTASSFHDTNVNMEDENSKSEWIVSPVIGMFYQQPDMNLPPFVRIGDSVREGDVIGVVESMKILNELRSPISGRVAEILVSDRTLVQCGQPLMRVTRDD
jgi:acetyl-CoA carboxylase biotin carboxyl carrier protein